MRAWTAGWSWSVGGLTENRVVRTQSSHRDVFAAELSTEGFELKE